MAEPSLPSAAELGISDGEYERIVLDLRRRHGVGAAPPPPPPTPVGRGVQKRLLYGALGVVAAVVLLPRVVAAVPHHQEPTYAFMEMVGSEPVTYSSCRAIQVAVYPAGGPPDAAQLVSEAVAKMRVATGLDIVVIGAFGGHAPNWNFAAAPVTPLDPISVSWQDGDALAEMTDDVAGLGGSPTIVSANGTPQRVAGTIALSRGYYGRLAEQGDHDEELAVLLHEFGHVLGLDHVDSSSELMFHDNVGRTTLGLGDLEGLRRLGQGPCL